MTNKLKDNDLSKVSAGQGEYSGFVDEVKIIKQDLKKCCSGIEFNSEYNNALKCLDTSIIDLEYNNIDGAKRGLSDASTILGSLSSKYPDLQAALMSFINQLVNVITRIESYHGNR